MTSSFRPAKDDVIKYKPPCFSLPFGNLVLVVFGDEITKILRNSLFIFHFVLPVSPCKRKTLFRKFHNLSDEKP